MSRLEKSISVRAHSPSCAGVWATLQFAWIQLQYPVVVLAFEKMLLTTAFTVSAMVTAWGFLAALGASHAPFYLAPALCGLYGLLARPLTTSFSVRGLKDSAIGRGPVVWSICRFVRMQIRSCQLLVVQRNEVYSCRKPTHKMRDLDALC